MKTWFTWIKENPAEFSLYSGSLLLLIWLAISFTAIQIVFTILLLAVFAFNIWLTKKSVALRLKRLKDLDEGNRKLLLDTNKAFDPTKAVESITENLQFAINFVREIGKGNFNARLEGVNEDNLGLNNANLAGELINMKVQMKTSAEAEQKRVWATQGLANFSDLIRTSTHDAKTLSQEVVIFLVKYLNANQGGVFIVNDEEDSRHFLELKAAYAFERKKYLNKVIELGEGLVGQAYLEKETIHLRKIPQHYVSITSGLGGANPSTLLLVPMKIEEQVLGVIELASFKNFEKHEIEFCEKIAETFASTLSGVKVNERTRQLLEQSQEQSEEMRAQEEEMRQNMEEMQATQEEMARKENSYIARIEKLEIALREATEKADAIQTEATLAEVETLTQKLAAQKDRILELQTEKDKFEKELSASKQQIELPNKWQQTGSDLMQSLEAMHIALAQLKK
ncbi:MAG: GAF domain-containing protein [Cyclobacteriaceae bacterium]|jgi:putative methionine-R-sulfoxide reductase with GAF domain|nr:GAF domain-containing protein [Flammeovirgaceae bacterium]MCZ8020302.1 GAF domain-containing protein [Cytophagales bacterium]MCZ8327147.1 GAF domain-containing protein [Cyclobacteriaceae bacterium]